MKIRKGMLEMMAAALLMAGCGTNESQEIPYQSGPDNAGGQIQNAKGGVSGESTEIIEGDVSDESSHDGKGDVPGEASYQQPESVSSGQDHDRLDEDRIIQEQSFQVELNDWGKVGFVSYEPDHAQGPDPQEDVTFYLLKDEEILYQFPYIGENHASGYGLFCDVKFVMFMDTNDDGKKDIVIGPEYCTGIGPQGAVPHTEVRIYEDCGDHFSYNEELSDGINGYLPWESNVLAKDVKRLVQLAGGDGILTDYESYTGKWSEGAGYVAAYEDPFPDSGNELTCTIRNGNEFSGSIFARQGITERFASVEDINGVIVGGELFYEFTDDGWGGTGTIHISFLPNQINVEVLDYHMSEENRSGYGISGSYEMTIRR